MITKKITIFLSKDINNDELQTYIDWFKLNFNEYKPKLVWVDNVIESDYNFSLETDVLIWHPKVAATNMSFLLQYNSVVVLMRPTILIQKNSKNNPITENMAINHGFKIMYINPENVDVTNKEYKLIISESFYLVKNIQQLIK